MRWMRWSKRTPWTSKTRERCWASIVAPDPVLLSCKLTPRGTRRAVPFSSTVSPSERVKLALPLVGMEARSAALDEAVTRSGRQNNILLRAEAAVPEKWPPTTTKCNASLYPVVSIPQFARRWPSCRGGAAARFASSAAPRLSLTTTRQATCLNNSLVPLITT
eukprot:scaffold1849_cov66-Phaeocystis_antarctica.AAC.5